MKIRGGLGDGSIVHLDFYAAEDLKSSKRGKVTKLVSKMRVSLPGTDASELLTWLKKKRKAALKGKTFRVTSSHSRLCIASLDETFELELGATNEIRALERELVGIIDQITGDGADRATTEELGAQ